MAVVQIAALDRSIDGEPLTLQPGGLSIPGVTMWEGIDDVDLRLDLEAATNHLTPKQREAVVLMLQGWTLTEIAEHCDVSKPAITYRVQTAVLTLRTGLNKPAPTG